MLLCQGRVSSSGRLQMVASDAASALDAQLICGPGGRSLVSGEANRRASLRFGMTETHRGMACKTMVQQERGG